MRLLDVSIVVLTLGVSGVAAELEMPKTTAAVVSAIQYLGDQARFEAARGLAQQWLQAHPDDPRVLLADANLLGLEAGAESDAARAKMLRKTAYAEAKRAKERGLDDMMMDIIFRDIDADGNDLTDPKRLAANPAAVAEMQAGEKAFAGRDLTAARQHYERALALDPHSYAAAVYIGDSYFGSREYEMAIEWFKKAIAIYPDAETAHRYLGDAYQHRDQLAAAEGAYIDAVLAEPYNRRTREMLARLAHRKGHDVKAPDIDVPMVRVELTAKGVEVGMDPNHVDPAVVAYALARSRWLTKERAKYFPKESQPRHSLPEECDGLRTLVKIAAESKAGGKPMTEHASAIKQLTELDQAGLLEAYVLLDRPDAGIAADYAIYRKTHRPALERYIRKVWLGQPVQPQKSETAR